MIKYYGPLFDLIVCLLALGAFVRYAFDHGRYETTVIFLLLAIFLKLGIIGNKE